jgi:hypothetical protein
LLHCLSFTLPTLLVHQMKPEQALSTAKSLPSPSFNPFHDYNPKHQIPAVDTVWEVLHEMVFPGLSNLLSLICSPTCLLTLLPIGKFIIKLEYIQVAILFGPLHVCSHFLNYPPSFSFSLLRTRFIYISFSRQSLLTIFQGWLSNFSSFFYHIRCLFLLCHCVRHILLG